MLAKPVCTRAPGLIIGFAALALLAGCGPSSGHDHVALTSAEQAYCARDYGGAVSQTTEYLQRNANGAGAARAFYVRGLAAAPPGRRSQAYTDLQRAARDHSDPQLTWQPLAALGVLYFEDESFDYAAQMLRAAATAMPNASPKDAVLYRLGMAYERAGRWAAARGPFAQLARELPGGHYARLAERRLALRADHFAVQFGAFSRAENAQEMAGQLAQYGLRTQVSAEPRNGTTYYVVLEGRYRDFAEATRGLARVKGYVADAVLWPG